MEFVSWDIRANVMDGIVALPKAYQLVREREIDISRGLKVWRVGIDDEGRLTARRRGLVVNQWTWRLSLEKGVVVQLWGLKPFEHSWRREMAGLGGALSQCPLMADWHEHLHVPVGECRSPMRLAPRVKRGRDKLRLVGTAWNFSPPQAWRLKPRCGLPARCSPPPRGIGAV